MCVPQLMGLLRQGWDKGEDKGQDKARRLEEDQTDQICRNGNVRTEGEDDECRPNSQKSSAVTASASRSPPQPSVRFRQTNLADITHLMFTQQQMDHTW